MTRLGIVPAAGKGRRFGGTYKELLPIGDNETMLSRTVDILERLPVDMTLVVTSHYKMAAHATALEKRNVKFAIQKGYERDAWDAIVESFDCAGDLNYYLMPDTWQPEGTMPENMADYDFALGLHTTTHPERFGVLWDGQILDKDNSIAGVCEAWGSIVWTKKVVDFWKEHPEIDTHTQAFNMAMKEFGFGTYPIPAYIDIASFKDYKELLAHV